ncbi:MAG: hypothetical protein NC200_03565, partial [Candidatus Gastranaerophilales bacterium]|nr:hypothetical protein [Candidatus Gastranaerophilales bacterium]
TPPNSTRIAPPDCAKNEMAVFKDGFWKVISDFRNQKQINKKTLEISYITEVGDLDTGYLLYSDYLNSESYLDEQKQVEIQNLYNDIRDEIKTLDEKRIRAICEPAIKDEETGETWLEYYTSQIEELREKLREV